MFRVNFQFTDVSTFKFTIVVPNQSIDFFRKDFAAKVFKVMHDKQKGALSLVRVLNGTLKKGDKIITSIGNPEVVQRIYEPLADEYREINDVSQGNVAICAGLKVCKEKYCQIPFVF